MLFAPIRFIQSISPATKHPLSRHPLSMVLNRGERQDVMDVSGSDRAPPVENLRRHDRRSISHNQCHHCHRLLKAQTLRHFTKHGFSWQPLDWQVFQGPSFCTGTYFGEFVKGCPMPILFGWAGDGRSMSSLFVSFVASTNNSLSTPCGLDTVIFSP